MKKLLLLALVLLFCAPAWAGTLYVNTGGLATNSGSTDTNSPTASGTAATVAGTTVTLDVGTNLGTVNTSGSNQTTINIAGATNSNRTIFWITSVTSGCAGTGACVIVVDTAPTGVTTNSWSVGGQYLFPGTNIVDKAMTALRAGDTMVFDNNPATRSLSYVPAAVASGDAVTGPITLMGKAGGGRILLDVGTNVSAVIDPSSGNPTNWYITNIEARQESSGTIQIIGGFGYNLTLDNVKVNHPTGTATTGSMVNLTGGQSRIVNSEIVSNNTGTGDCINTVLGNNYLINNFIHGCGGNGFTSSVAQPAGPVEGNIFANITGSAINLSGASTTMAGMVALNGNTFYNNGNAVTSAAADTVLWMTNNIFYNNGSGANYNFTANCLASYHQYNIVFASGGTNTTNCPLNSTEVNSDPLFVNASVNNFAISNSSPAAGTGIPGTPSGSGSTGYRDMGAIQRQVSASVGGGHIIGSGL